MCVFIFELWLVQKGVTFLLLSLLKGREGYGGDNG